MSQEQDLEAQLLINTKACYYCHDKYETIEVLREILMERNATIVELTAVITQLNEEIEEQLLNIDTHLVLAPSPIPSDDEEKTTS